MRKFIVFFILALAFAVFILSLEFCSDKPAAGSQEITAANNYVGDSKCKDCHLKEYDDWLKSDHFKAMESANDSTVLGNFRNATFVSDGVRWTMQEKEGRFYITTQEQNAETQTYQVLYTFGFFPLQQYLVALPGGKMQATRLSWDSRNKKWFQQYAGQKIHPKDWLHWTRGAQNWNTMCASCHSTNLQKNYFPESDSFHTTWSVINVSCESCHGPGEKHITFINSDDYKNGNKVPGSFLQITKKENQQGIINSCAPCHALKSDISSHPIQSAEFLDNYIPESPATERFYPDGQVKDEAYVYTSFLQSKMYRFGVACNNCHNPHSGKLLFTANQLCLQCHAKKYDEPGHHFHAVNTAGAECRSCHMPAGTFMGNDIRHDHAFRVPRPDLSVSYGTPNACNNCHTNRSNQWSADAVNKWYGPVRKYHFAEDLVPGSRLDATSEAHLRKLLADTTINAMPKAAALTYLGNIMTAGSALALTDALRASNAQMRYQALRSLANFPPDRWRDVAAPLLNDKVRAVRIAAADLYLTVPPEQIPGAYLDAFSRARTELQQYLEYQRDFPSGNVMLGDHYFRLSDYENAIRFYSRGLAMDSLMNYARLNLSAAYNAAGKNEQALATLKTAAAIDAKNDRIFYNLGLLYSELNRPADALENFGRAVKLKSNNPRLYYNYGLLLHQSGQQSKAEQVLLQGLSISPSEPDLNYAIAFLYVNTGRKEKATRYALALKSLAPANPNYQALYDEVLR